jgi:Peptidase M50B-like
MARVVFIGSVLVTAAAYAVPELQNLTHPLRLLSTLFHEMGHGIAALAVGGSFRDFELFSDGSGIAYTSSPDTSQARAIVAAGGLVGPAVAAALCFIAGKTPGFARFLLAIFAVAALFACVWIVKNSFGMVFVGGVGVVLGWIALQSGVRGPQIALILLGTQLALSVYSRADYLFTPVAHTLNGSMPSDVATIASALLMPYWFWGVVCGGFSLLVLLLGVRVLWR